MAGEDLAGGEDQAHSSVTINTSSAAKFSRSAGDLEPVMPGHGAAGCRVPASCSIASYIPSSGCPRAVAGGTLKSGVLQLVCDNAGAVRGKV